MKIDELLNKRKHKGWTQKQTVEYLKVKEDIDITDSFYGMIERGERNPTLKLAKSIANIFDSNVEELFFSNTNNTMLNNEDSNQKPA